jgi:hypothetical protein
MKEEMEELKEAAVNKREDAANLERHVCSDEGKRALKMRWEGRYLSKGS